MFVLRFTIQSFTHSLYFTVFYRSDRTSRLFGVHQIMRLLGDSVQLSPIALCRRAAYAQYLHTQQHPEYACIPEVWC